MRKPVEPPSWTVSNFKNDWAESLFRHKKHKSFRTQDNAFHRTLGFSCGCEDYEKEWWIPLTHYMLETPQARTIYQHLRNRESARTKKEIERANVRAKELLLYNLTVAQRKELRTSNAITIVGKDQKTYRITKGPALNVQLLQDGVATHSLCVIAKGVSLPVYDLMLAQKLMLESNPEGFWKIAVVRSLISERPPTGSGLITLRIYPQLIHNLV